MTVQYKILLQVLDAMANMHAKDMMHRDLKPDNILIDGKPDALKTDEFVAYICDFGTVRSIEQTKELQTAIGTEEYMAPEVSILIPLLQLDGLNILLELSYESVNILTSFLGWWCLSVHHQG